MVLYGQSSTLRLLCLLTRSTEIASTTSDDIAETMFFNRYGGYSSGPDDILGGFCLPTDLVQYFRRKVDAVSYIIASSPWMDLVKKS